MSKKPRVSFCGEKKAFATKDDPGPIPASFSNTMTKLKKCSTLKSEQTKCVAETLIYIIKWHSIRQHSRKKRPLSLESEYLLEISLLIFKGIFLLYLF